MALPGFAGLPANSADHSDPSAADPVLQLVSSLSLLNEAPAAFDFLALETLRSSDRKLSARSLGGFRVDISDREQVRSFYFAVHAASDGADAGWTGDVVTCNAGTTTPVFREAVLRRINYFRAMAGIPATVVFSDTYSAKAQEAALMMAAQGSLSHFPGTDWACYSATGAEAAGASNLRLGGYGPSSVDGYIEDAGSNNAVVGHRRWLLYPQTQTMGTGDFPRDDGHMAANAIWVMDGRFGTERPVTREPFVAWPPPGYVPFTMVFPRWSFSYPGADFAAATVTLNFQGESIPVVREPVGTGFGEPTLVWLFADSAAAAALRSQPPTADAIYQVAIHGVRVGGASRDFEYAVRVFDPADPGAGGATARAAVSGPSQVPLGTTAEYQPNAAVSWIEDYEVRQLALDSAEFQDHADAGLDQFEARTSPGYELVPEGVRPEGGRVFHLAHAEPVRQSLATRATFLAGPRGELTFASRLGWASLDQQARVEISFDDGRSWLALYRQAGTGDPGEQTFDRRTISLAGFAGSTFRLRWVYDFDTGRYFPQTDSDVGWCFDDIAVTGCETVDRTEMSVVSAGGAYRLTPQVEGSLALQARGRAFGGYGLDWGEAFRVQVTSASEPRIVCGSPVSSDADGRLMVPFRVVGLPAGTAFRLQAAGSVNAPWQIESSALLEVLTSGSEYRFLVAPPASTRFYRVLTP